MAPRPSCVVHVWHLPGEKRPRYTPQPGVGAVVRTLGDAAGLTHMGVQLRSIEPGLARTNRHFHTVEEEWDRTDEWVFVLGGRARLRVGDERCEVGPGDFAGHPARGPAHGMEPIEPLTYLMGGERDPGDVVTYPEAGVRRVAGRLEPLGG